MRRLLFNRLVLTAGSIACLGIAAPNRAEGQGTDSAASVKPRSTLDTLFTMDQAKRGKDVYAGFCNSCHATSSHTGPNFQQNWIGKTLADLFTYLSEKMPENNPGSLSTDQNRDVLAYIMQLNAWPSGSVELPGDPAVLKGVKIEASGPKQPSSSLPPSPPRLPAPPAPLAHPPHRR